MTRQEVENAINELDILLENNLSDEQYYQEYLEKHSVVFKLLGYKRVIPHPKLQSNDKLLIPDFIVQNIDDSWSIIEIKRPDTGILKNRERRKEFYSFFREYISQCHEYREYFDDITNRNNFNEKNNSDIDKSMIATIIAGRNKGINKGEIKNILFREGARIYLKTYDDIRNYLEHHRKSTWSTPKYSRGFTLAFALIIKKKDIGLNYILDFGLDLNRNRISLFVNTEDQLIFRVIDNNSHTHLVKIDQNTLGFKYEKPSIVNLDLGVSAGATSISLEIDGLFFKDITLDEIDFDDSYLNDNTKNNYMNIIVGSDITEKEESCFKFGELAIYSNKLTFDQKSELRRFFWYKEINFPTTFGNSGYLRAISVTHKKLGVSSLSAKGHPLRLISKDKNKNNFLREIASK